MEFKFDAHVIHHDVEDGKLKCGVLLTSGDDAFHEAAIAHCTEEGNYIVELYIQFEPKMILDDMIERHELRGVHGNPLCPEAKPFIEEIKKELQKMLARIETIKYVE